MKRVLSAILTMFVPLLFVACETGGTNDSNGDNTGNNSQDVAVDKDYAAHIDLPELEGNALRIVFPAGYDQVLCKGRFFDTSPHPEGVYFDLNVVTEEWDSDVIICQGVQDDPIGAPGLVMAFKEGLPLWTPNMDADNTVRADAGTTATAMAFLTPHLLTNSPERAKFLLERTWASPYLGQVSDAVAAQDTDMAGKKLASVVADVLAQASIEAGLSASTNFDMDHLDVTVNGNYMDISANLGSSVDFLCVVYQLPQCTLESNADFSAVETHDHFQKTELHRIYVPANSYFKFLRLTVLAMGAIFDLLMPPDDTGYKIDPGYVYEIQCYSGSLGGSAAEYDKDWAFILDEGDGKWNDGSALVANLVALATDTVSLLIDLKAFEEDQTELISYITICTKSVIGPSLKFSDEVTGDNLMAVGVGLADCVVDMTIKKAAGKGLTAVLKWALGNVMDKIDVLGKVGKAGMILDRIAGMTLFISPLERQLLAHEVDFNVCCTNDCAYEGEKTCVDETSFAVCGQYDSDDCLDWSTSTYCGQNQACLNEGSCAACGGVGQPCCELDVCGSGNSCQGGTCVEGCVDECSTLGESFCVDKTRYQTCGELDTDVCKDLSMPQTCPEDHVCEEGECVVGCSEECPAHFECVGADCVCDAVDIDFTDQFPGYYIGFMDDSGVSLTDHDSLWPEQDKDMVHYYIYDDFNWGGGSVHPNVTVADMMPGVQYDVCVAFECDSTVNDGELDSYECNGASKTEMNGLAACCMYGVAGDVTIDMTAGCTWLGSGDDSGWAYVSIESTQGEQCWPHYHLTMAGSIQD